jgi:hypothetical protein
MNVVRRCAQEQTVRDVTNDEPNVRIRRVSRHSCGRGDVRLVENQKALRGAFADVLVMFK